MSQRSDENLGKAVLAFGVLAVGLLVVVLSELRKALIAHLILSTYF